MKSCIFLLAFLPASAAPLYNLANIGGVGESLSEAFAINVSGVAAGRSFDFSDRSHGFAYESFVEVFPADTDARGINAAGDIVGTKGEYATVWRGGSAESLGTLGGSASYGLGINDSGQTTGAALRSDGRMHAFLSFNGQMLDAGTLGGSWSAGYGVNNAGEIAGVSESSNGAHSGFIWDNQKGMRQLVGVGGTDNTRAFAINSGGAVAGASMSSQGGLHAAMWDKDGVVTDLGSLGGSSYAYGLNDGGSVVGYSYDVFGRQRAFVWTGGMLFDLNASMDATDWTLTAAYGINAKGQIVGTGYYKGVSSAFRLDPVATLPQDDVLGSPVPEPGTTASVVIGLTIACLYKRKR